MFDICVVFFTATTGSRVMLENWLQFQIICVQNAVKTSNWCSSVRVLRTPSPTYRRMDYENLLKLKQSPLCNILNLFLTIERGSIYSNSQSLNKNWEGEAVNEKVWANDWYACIWYYQGTYLPNQPLIAKLCEIIVRWTESRISQWFGVLWLRTSIHRRLPEYRPLKLIDCFSEYILPRPISIYVSKSLMYQ